MKTHGTVALTRTVFFLVPEGGFRTHCGLRPSAGLFFVAVIVALTLLLAAGGSSTTTGSTPAATPTVAPPTDLITPKTNARASH
ncbi:MAG: hypothetical protein ACYDER_23010 [Ktedonobacteraceae bacterium]